MRLLKRPHHYKPLYLHPFVVYYPSYRLLMETAYPSLRNVH